MLIYYIVYRAYNKHTFTINICRDLSLYNNYNYSYNINFAYVDLLIVVINKRLVLRNYDLSLH